MDEVTTSVATADAGAGAEQTATQVDSGTTEQAPTGQVETSEKTEIAQAETTDGADTGSEEIEKEEAAEQSVPYSRFKEVNDQVKQLKDKAELFDKMRDDPDLARQVLPNYAAAQQEVDPVVEQADSQLKKMGYVKATEVDQLVEQKIKSAQQAQRFADQMLDMEKSHDGSDGSPKFVIDDVLDYMEQYGMTDPEKAYQVMNLDAIVDTRAKEAKKGTPKTESQSGGTQTAGSDTKALIAEAKSTGNWSKVLGAKGLLDRYKR